MEDFDINGENIINNSKIHIRIKKRTNRKYITTIEGLSKSLDYKKLVKILRNKFCCSGFTSNSESEGCIILNGDHRENLRDYLINNSYATDDDIVVHGF